MSVVGRDVLRPRCSSNSGIYRIVHRRNMSVPFEVASFTLPKQLT